MKIALVSPYDFPYPGGVTEHIVGLAKTISQRGHEVHILAACSGYQNVTVPNTQVITRRVIPFPIGGTVARIGWSPRSYQRIKQLLQREAFEVIHLHEPLTPGLTWLVLQQCRNLPRTVTIGTFHAYHERPNWFYSGGRSIFGKFFARLDALIAVSEAARDFADQMFPADYQVIPNGVDLARFARENSKDTSFKQIATGPEVTILFVGRLDKRKGFETLLRAFIKLKANFPHLRLKVAGPFAPPEAARYRPLIPHLHATDIAFVGYVSPEGMSALYHSADIFCAPSLGFESFGVVLLEAMAAGLPIVTTDIAGYRSVLTAGQEGLLVPPERADLLAEALAYLIKNPHLRRAMGERGRQKAGEYSWDHIGDKILKLYHDTIEIKLKTMPPVQSRFHLQPRHANPEGKSC